MTRLIHFPRLDASKAFEARRGFLRRDAETIEFDEGAFDEALQDARAFPVTGGARITPRELADLRQSLLEAVARAEKSATLEPDAAFDLEVGRELNRAGHDAHGDFGDPRVWDFVTLVLGPDIAARRIATLASSHQESTSTVKRITGGDRRHIFQKLWKRWQVFGIDVVESSRLTEDDYVATLERRITLERGRLARQVAHAITGSGFTGSSRRTYTRVFMRNLQQASGLVQIRDDDAEAVRTIVDHVHDQTVRSLNSPPL